MLVNRFDTSIGGMLVEYGAYREEEVNRCFDLIKSKHEKSDGNVVGMDIGANIGSHSISWSKMMRDWGSGVILSIEVQQHTYYALCGNIVLNNCWNIRAIWAAVGSQSGYIRIPEFSIDQENNFGSFSLCRDIGANLSGRIRKTPALTVDSLNLNRLDLMKIDVEGLELEVLKGAVDTIQRYKPIIVAESLLYPKFGDWLEILPNYMIKTFDDMNLIMEPM